MDCPEKSTDVVRGGLGNRVGFLFSQINKKTDNRLDNLADSVASQAVGQGEATSSSAA
jgi:hypothetical protein